MIKARSTPTCKYPPGTILISKGGMRYRVVRYIASVISTSDYSDKPFYQLQMVNKYLGSRGHFASHTVAAVESMEVWEP